MDGYIAIGWVRGPKSCDSMTCSLYVCRSCFCFYQHCCMSFPDCAICLEPMTCGLAAPDCGHVSHQVLSRFLLKHCKCYFLLFFVSPNKLAVMHVDRLSKHATLLLYAGYHMHQQACLMRWCDRHDGSCPIYREPGPARQLIYQASEVNEAACARADSLTAEIAAQILF
jgi:hypothetical protein